MRLRVRMGQAQVGAVHREVGLQLGVGVREGRCGGVGSWRCENVAVMGFDEGELTGSCMGAIRGRAVVRLVTSEVEIGGPKVGARCVEARWEINNRIWVVQVSWIQRVAGILLGQVGWGAVVGMGLVGGQGGQPGCEGSGRYFVRREVVCLHNFGGEISRMGGEPVGVGKVVPEGNVGGGLMMRGAFMGLVGGPFVIRINKSRGSGKSGRRRTKSGGSSELVQRR